MLQRPGEDISASRPDTMVEPELVSSGSEEKRGRLAGDEKHSGVIGVEVSRVLSVKSDTLNERPLDVGAGLEEKALNAEDEEM